MKSILRQILSDRKRGLSMSHRQCLAVEAEWLRLFGVGGVDCYPYLKHSMMIGDLQRHYKLED